MPKTQSAESKDGLDVAPQPWESRRAEKFVIEFLELIVRGVNVIRPGLVDLTLKSLLPVRFDEGMDNWNLFFFLISHVGVSFLHC